MSVPFPTAVVTGASRGFGRAIAAALVAAGTAVVGIARDRQALLAVREELGGGFSPVAADATDELTPSGIGSAGLRHPPLGWASLVTPSWRTCSRSSPRTWSPRPSWRWPRIPGVSPSTW
jgi:NAD(P)-dependent dehydrogenase (short-subunit alcohol dehydrogenase family)